MYKIRGERPQHPSGRPKPVEIVKRDSYPDYGVGPLTPRMREKHIDTNALGFLYDFHRENDDGSDV